MNIKLLFKFSLFLILSITQNIKPIYAQLSRTNVPYGGYIQSLLVSESNIFAGVQFNGIFKSTDGGQNWIEVNEGIPEGSNIHSFLATNTNIFAGIGDGRGVYTSNDNGSTWTSVNNGLPLGAARYILAISDTNILVGTTYGGGVYSSTNNGLNWTPINNGLPEDTYKIQVTALITNKNDIFLGTATDGVFRSSDNGKKWTYCGFKDTTVTSLAFSSNELGDTSIFVGTWFEGLFRSNDNGKNWIANENVYPCCQIEVLSASGTNIYAGTWSGGVFLSSDNGASWNSINNGLSTDYGIYALSAFTDKEGNINLIVGNTRGVNLSIDNGASWDEINDGLTGINNYTLAAAGENLFVGTNIGVFRSTNNGDNWYAVHNGFDYPGESQVWDLTFEGTKLYAGTYGNGVFLSTNNGDNWNHVGGSPTPEGAGEITAIAAKSDIHGDLNVFAGTYSGLFQSKDNFITWSPVTNGLPTASILDIAISNESIYTLLNLPDDEIYVSSNGFTNWTAVSGFPNNMSCLAVYDSNIFVGLQYIPGLNYNRGIYLSTNSGKDWIDLNLRFHVTIYVKSIVVSSSNIFVLTSDNQIWTKPLSEILTDIKEIENNLPTKISLAQNYPNPFNPTTSIEYSVPSNEYVSLKVYDILGKEIASLVNEQKSAGNYKVNFDALNISSGIYFYKIQAGSFNQVRKMMLLK